MRSRYIDPSKDSSNDVLLDENFLNRKTAHTHREECVEMRIRTVRS